MTKRVAVVTNVTDYAGPPVAAALAADGAITLCHSEHFVDPGRRAAYERDHPGQLSVEAQSPEDVVAEALTRFGRLDVAVSNDAGDVRRGGFEHRSADDYRALLEAFAVRPARLAAAAVVPMKAQGGGRIVLVTSSAPLRPQRDLALYAASRAATNSLVKSLAVELGASNISVNAVAPLYLESNYFPLGMDDPVFADRVREVIPMQRMGRPDEVGALVALLASGRADFVSGQVIAFSGGGA